MMMKTAMIVMIFLSEDISSSCTFGVMVLSLQES